MEIRELKDHIKAASHYLAEQGIQVPHTRLLEAFSRTVGERNWATLRARMTVPSQGPAHQAAHAPAQDHSRASAQHEWDPSKGPMAETTFVHYKGNRCPVCGSDNLQAQDLDADGPDVWDDCTCQDCGATWKTAYAVCGYFGLQPGKQAASSGGSPAWRPDADEVVALYDLNARNLRRRVWLFSADSTLPVLARHYDLDPRTQLRQALERAHNDEDALTTALEAGQTPLYADERHSLRHAWADVVGTARHKGLRVLSVVREDVVESLVEDATDRAREHEFRAFSLDNAFELAAMSAQALNLEAGPAELEEAARRLYLR